MKVIRIISLLFVISFGHHLTHAQNFNLEPADVETLQVGLKVNLPQFKQDEYNNFSSFSGAYTTSIQVPLKNRWGLYAEIPYVYAKTDYTSESGIGNLFLIARKSLNDTQTSRVSFGGYLPTIGEESYYTQDIIFHGNVYRFSQAVNAYTIYGNYSYQLPSSGAPIFGLELGPDIIIPKEGGETELFFHLGLKGGYKFNHFWVWSELNGIVIASESDIDLNDRILSQLVVGGQAQLGKFKPGLFYSIPLKEYMRSYQHGTIGLRLDFEF